MQAHDPFNTAKPLVTTAKTKSGYRSRLNPDDLEISDDPMPAKRQAPSQYDAIFSQLKVGQCIKVEPDRIDTIGNALRSWIRRNKKKNVMVKSVRAYKGCKEKLGRVWLIEKPQVKA